LADLWSNNDLEFSQKVNAQNGSSNSGLQKSGSKKLALKLYSFFNESSRGDRMSICPFEKGTRWLEFRLQGTMLKVAPVSIKYLSLVSSSERKINPALAGKCMAMAVACVEMAAEPKRVWWQFSFLTKHSGDPDQLWSCLRSRGFIT
jgi:hypothetical protein